ncbi:MAG TPA: ABC transporter ATP-binding protein [Vicinamibacterales bacterium]|nr:ABC transporter ATP-binding protein [Vicinamibacterales bacterium]
MIATTEDSVSSVVALAPPVAAARETAASVAVSLEGLNKRFALRRTWAQILKSPFTHNYAQALTDVSFTIERGEFFGLLGPNGAGKTTLFKILATLIIPDSGRALVNGFDCVRQVREVRRQLVPVVADERSLRWRLDAWENLRLYAVLYGVPKAEMKSRIEHVLDVVGLANTGTKTTGQFSSGMKQRLLIARALLARPRVLLLDEPTRGLDPLSARALRTVLKDDVCRGQGCTVVLATHNAEEAFNVCDRVAILDRGRLLTTGRASRLAEAFTDERYRVWVRATGRAALDELAASGQVLDVRQTSVEDDGWTVMEMRLPGGPSAAARVLASLVSRHVEVARFEPMQVSLAELIERVQQSSRAQEQSNA